MNLPTVHIEWIEELGHTEFEACFLNMLAVLSINFTVGTSACSFEAHMENVLHLFLRAS